MMKDEDKGALLLVAAVAVIAAGAGAFARPFRKPSSLIVPAVFLAIGGGCLWATGVFNSAADKCPVNTTQGVAYQEDGRTVTPCLDTQGKPTVLIRR